MTGTPDEPKRRPLPEVASPRLSLLRIRGLLPLLVLVVFVAWMFKPMLDQIEATLGNFRFSHGWLRMADADRLRAFRVPQLHWHNFLDSRMRRDECVLLFRQADYAAYGRGCYFSYLDHRLIPLYLARSEAEVTNVLRQHHIRYIAVSNYMLPELYNSRMESLLADPARAEIVWSLDGSNIYRLRDEAEPKARRRSLLDAKGADLDLLDVNGRPSARLRLRNARPYVDELRTPLVPAKPIESSEAYSTSCNRPFTSPKLRGYEVEVSGSGYLYLVLQQGLMIQPDSQSALSQAMKPLWDGAIDGARALRGQYVVEPGQCDPFYLRFSARGRSDIAVTRIHVFEYPHIEVPAAMYERQRALAQGWSGRSSNHLYERSWNWGRNLKGQYYVRQHQFPLERVVLVSPISDSAILPIDAPIQIPISIRATFSGSGRAAVRAVILMDRNAESKGLPVSDALRQIRAEAERPREQLRASSYGRFYDTLLGRQPRFEALDATNADTMLQSGWRQEIRRYTLFEGKLGSTPISHEFSIQVEPHDRIQIEFEPIAQAGAAAPNEASILIDALDIVAVIPPPWSPVRRSNPLEPAGSSFDSSESRKSLLESNTR